MLWSWLSIAATAALSVTATSVSEQLGVSMDINVDAIDSTIWENVHYYRNVDLSGPYIKEFDLIEAKNTSPEPQDTYVFTVNDGFDSVPNISYIGVTVMDLKLELYPFKLGQGIYAIKFTAPIAPGSTVEFKTRYAYTNTLVPFPEKINMDESQSLLAKINKYAYSPYVISDYSLAFTGFPKAQEMDLQFTNVTVSPNLPALKGRVESEALVYGPVVSTIQPYAVVPMGLLYDHARPLTRVINLERSFWLPGSGVDVVLTEEYYELTNNGAQLKSGYSRGDWMKGRYDLIREHFAISQLEFPENPAATFEDYYITDKVGKVSSHHPAQGHIIMQPRFPLFGGWKYNFTLGWSNKMEHFVHTMHNDDNVYIAKFPMLNGLREIYYDDVYLNFYLPEGSEFISFHAPVVSEDVTVGAEASYLDVSDGHVKVRVHFRNLCDSLSLLEVYVKYRYSASSYRYKLLKIAGFVFTGLASYYALGLLNLSIEQN
ncbi:CIC11C00000001716 [Sungouiella intermedia]|uniref:Dolichyl-diphosphooligosaccharide--protein glycosyltransferase subunit 1 n=1 Tax=Sungouiella intermedia TaxID=45354 RepID=A0A1L0DRP6_9ASCO|nr:CIC11C00000001716 [[Candida] intermedia]